MNPYEQYVQTLADLAVAARHLPLGGFADYPTPAVAADAPVALIFSPHPDDEVIIGGWALRLLRQSRWRVVNVAVTHGSNRDRQPGRWAELQSCCRCIGFDLVTAAPSGFEGVTEAVRAGEPGRWRQMVEVVAGLLERCSPRAIFYPHPLDRNSTHVGTSWLVTDALRAVPSLAGLAAIETEFWAQNPTPNLLVESSAAEVGALVTALTSHAGEVRRNPYHLTLPAWMMDNVRRGAEWVGGQGQAAPSFLFGTLYRVQTWTGRAFEARPSPNGFLESDRDPAEGLGGSAD